MITEREQEILDLIRQDPLISQQALADRLGVSRSAVAGHIMNLSNKGAIRGKGYILADSPYVVVIGGANMDILGQPCDKLLARDSNPGRVSCSPGGVARNIAENLARLGVDVRLIAPLGKDVYGQTLLEQGLQCGIDMRHCLQLDDAVTSTYLSVLDESGDMSVAINDMQILERLSVEYLRSHADMIRRASLLIVDANLPANVLEYLLSQFPDLPIFADPVSGPKSEKLRGLLDAIHTFKPNLAEAKRLSGVDAKDEGQLPQLASWFHRKGIKRICISLGAQGVYVSEAGRHQLYPPPPIQPVNANGAGDAFLAGLAYGWLAQWSTPRSVNFATAASAVAMSHQATINPNMSLAAVNRLLEETYS
ncbi:Sugar kinase, ribokinase family [Hahella chejuensis KCTC 2396]|uniref:Sugar kinase, ribokinase family n=1 Tax=Hahella chejuensis (strain KCTC 2396) TaxID=349521 RepID=Q2SM68_HAHCH|nr:PfkB family carbohydrate kinase [Hahella chejuensis]ABC28256.1 Sugar kinase, ribokinase family [Hahella chejuensis KCTC 2396]